MIELLISSAILITVLAVIRYLVRGRIPVGFQYALWLLVLLRLALPFHLFPSTVSAAGAITQVMQTEQADEPEQTASPLQSNATPGANVQAAGKLGFDQILRRVWISGSLIAAIWFGAVNLKLTFCLRRSRRRLRCSAPIPVYIANGLPSPCLYGLFRPAVYLTEQAVRDPQKAEIAVTHELTHWRHRDNLWSAARLLCLIVYWFDPFVWLAAWLSKQDGELYCDACAIGRLGEKHRYEYGRVLLEMTEAVTRPANLICSASTMSGGAKRMRERIALIACRPKRSVPMIAAAIAVMVIATACTFSGASEAPDNEPAKLMTTSPPWTAETPSVNEIAAASPQPISEANEQETVTTTPVPTQIPEDTSTPVPTPTPANTQTPVPTQMPKNTSAPAPRQIAGNTPEPIEPEDQEDVPVYEPPADNGVTPAPPTPPTDETDIPLDEPSLPVATPPTEDTEPIVVRDMRDVYIDTGIEQYPDMPSTVPDSPPPETYDEAPTDDTSQVIVRDMRDAFANTSGIDPYPDMPSTVPDSPPPASSGNP